MSDQPSIQPPLPPPPPVPVAPLAYPMSGPAGTRPGLVTAIGVVSIVIACLGALASIWTVLSLMWFGMVASFAGAARITPPAPVITAAPAGSAAPGSNAQPPTTGPAAVAGPRGLGEQDRAAVAEGLAEMQFLSEPRLAQLDELLANAGRDMFPVTSGTPLTAEAARAEVQANTVGLSADPSVTGPDTFRLNSGRIELYDGRAVFYPSRGGEIVRTSRVTAASAGLSAEQVETVVQNAQAASGNTMNPAQVAALRSLLTTPGQPHVTSVTFPTAIRSASLQGDGSISITFANSSVDIGPQGQLTTTTTAGGAGVTTGAPAPLARAARVNRAALTLAMLATFASAGLAIYLFVIGILVLRDSPRGRRLHLVYAALKIPLTVATVAVMWWLTSDFLNAMLAANASGPGADAGSAVSAAIAIPQTVLAVLGLIYPVVLLIVLQTRAVKDYYRIGVGA